MSNFISILVSADLDMSPELVFEPMRIVSKARVYSGNSSSKLAAFAITFGRKICRGSTAVKRKVRQTHLSTVTDDYFRERILMTVKATQRSVFFSCVAIGAVQLMALTPSIADIAKTLLRAQSKFR